MAAFVLSNLDETVAAVGTVTRKQDEARGTVWTITPLPSGQYGNNATTQPFLCPAVISLLYELFINNGTAAQMLGVPQYPTRTKSSKKARGKEYSDLLNPQRAITSQDRSTAQFSMCTALCSRAWRDARVPPLPRRGASLGAHKRTWSARQGRRPLRGGVGTWLTRTACNE